MARRTLWRLERERYADTAFTGEGARLHGNRFNSKGTPVVYAAESLPLALLEVLVGLPDYGRLHPYVFFRADLPANHVETVNEDELPAGWDAHPPTTASKRVGDGWAASGRSLALCVPSVIVPHSHNYLLNPAHPAFEEIEVHEAENLPVDDRLVK